MKEEDPYTVDDTKKEEDPDAVNDATNKDQDGLPGKARTVKEVWFAGGHGGTV